MLKVYPFKEGRLANEVTRLPILVQLQPPEKNAGSSPDLSLGLVLDRSGSMSGEKLHLTIQAACEAVKRLSADDNVTVVTFDDQVELLYSGAARDEGLLSMIQSITSGNQTDLHSGWAQCAQAMQSFLEPSRLSRLILLTDGEANHGLTEPGAICRHVSAQASRGIQTTTLGFGAHYNEDLLRTMAQAGGGNHCYIENAEMLGKFFSEEMQALADTQGTFVRLKIDPAPGVIVEGFESKIRDLEGRLLLANLVAGQPLSVVFTAEISPEVEGELLQFKLEWHDLAEGERRQTTVSRTLPSMDRQSWEALEGSTLVQEHLAIEEASFLRKQAMRLLRLEAHEVALQWLDWAAGVPFLPEEEKAAMEDLSDTLLRGDYSAGFKKAAMYGHGHGHGHARVVGHYVPKTKPAAKRKEYNKVPIGKGKVLGKALKEDYPRWRRVEGMLRGHFFGERLVRGNRVPLAEGSSLSVATIRLLLHQGFLPKHLAHALAQAPVLHPTTSLRKFRHRYEEGSGVLLELGSESAGCAALRRVCPLLVNLHHDVREDLFIEGMLATLLTHRDNLAITASIGYLKLLWALLHEPMPPKPEFYRRVFLEAIEGLEYGDGYQAPQQNKAMDGWRGHLQEYLPRMLAEARKQAWSAETAMKLWGSGPYLLEIVPTVLYILELHGHDPDRALRIATQTFEPDTPAILVGAALGALHGGMPGWFLDEEVESLLDATRKAWTGAGLLP